MPVMVGAEPFSHDAPPADGRRLGAVLVHGFTGSPQSMRPWAEHLAAAGLSVRLPRLPGHGTTWQEMQATRWPDWLAEADRAVGELRATCDAVVVMGLSMGGTLTLRLAEQHGDALAGIVTVNASLSTEDRRLRALPLLKRVLRSVPGVAGDIALPGATELGYDRVPLQAMASLVDLWAVTRADLGRICCPVLAFRSAVDHVVEASSGRLLLEGVTGAEVTEVVLERSFHVATLDHDAEQIFAGSLAFARRCAVPA